MSSEDTPDPQTAVRQWAPADVRKAMADGWQPLLIDVREPWEWPLASLPDDAFDVLRIPLAGLPAAIPGLPRNRPLLFVCHHGIRSWHAACMMVQYSASGQDMDIVNLAGGIDAWSRDVDPAIPRY
ncbi:MAG: rhodanese-like domain-containing protein [Gammaproteobacteria bacterium]|nr:rhodanese-like domain-containing protein [Gammaproteobacteria bacterium]